MSNPLDMNRRRFLRGAMAFTLVSSLISTGWDDAYAAYLPVHQPSFNAIDYGVKGDGTTDDSSAINNLYTLALAAGAAVWFPGGRTYDLSFNNTTVPDGLTVVASATATFRRSVDPSSPAGNWQNVYNFPSGAMITLGSNVNWTGGVLTNTAILGTSTTSITPPVLSGSAATVVWTLASGGSNMVAGSFIRIQSAGTPLAQMEGSVTSNTGGILTVSVLFSGGTGAHTDWGFFASQVYQCPMVMHGSSKTVVSFAQCTGNWYVGFLMEGWNPSTGGSLNCANCSYVQCYSIGVFNRGFYLYGTTTACVLDRCLIDGLGGITDYGINVNPANPTGTINVALNNTFIACGIQNVGYQGIGLGDQCFYSTISGCTFNGILANAGVGILILFANGLSPQFIVITGNIVRSAVAAGMQFGGVNHVKAVNTQIISCGVGVFISDGAVGQHCTECAVEDMDVSGCTTGVLVATNQLNTLLTGRSTGNTTNVTDLGTGTVKANLITV